MKTTKTDRPMIKDLSDDALVEHYAGLKTLIYNGAAMKQTRGMSRMLREFDITIAVARKRGVRLPV